MLSFLQAPVVKWSEVSVLYKHEGHRFNSRYVTFSKTCSAVVPFCNVLLGNVQLRSVPFSVSECCDISTQSGQKIHGSKCHITGGRTVFHPKLPLIPRVDDKFKDYMWVGHNDIVDKMDLGRNIPWMKSVGRNIQWM